MDGGNMDISCLVSLLLAVASIVLAIVIALRQSMAIKSQNGLIESVKMISDETRHISDENRHISNETKSIAKTTAADAHMRRMGMKLLSSGTCDTSHKKHTIVVPVRYANKPLPVIEQGDFYAIQILTLALGIENIELKEIETSDDVTHEELSGDYIFLCSPQTNPLLSKIIPYAIFKEGEAKDTFPDDPKYRLCTNANEKKKWLKEIWLPCWFVSDYDDNDAPKNGFTKRIQIFDLDDYDKDDKNRMLDPPLSSKAEQWYKEASEDGGKINVPKVEDYGILARLSHENINYLVIAGIHQYGTWIVSEFLRKVLHDEIEDREFNQIFNNGTNFITIISGDYNGSTLAVECPNIFRGNCWIKRSDQTWVRYNRERDKAKCR
jgi:hypothetical protein